MQQFTSTQQVSVTDLQLKDGKLWFLANIINPATNRVIAQVDMKLEYEDAPDLIKKKVQELESALENHYTIIAGRIDASTYDPLPEEDSSLNALFNLTDNDIPAD